MEKRKLLKAAGVEQVIRNRWNPKGVPNIRAGVYSTQVSEAKRQEDKSRFRSFEYKSNDCINPPGASAIQLHLSPISNLKSYIISLNLKKDLLTGKIELIFFL